MATDTKELCWIWIIPVHQTKAVVVQAHLIQIAPLLPHQTPLHLHENEVRTRRVGRKQKGLGLLS